MTTLLPEATRREAFHRLVSLQDELQRATSTEVRMTYLHTSRERIGVRYALTFNDVKEIEREGIRRGCLDEEEQQQKGAA
jgi:hypothetical protein